MQIHLVTPTYPPTKCGVADYSAQLAAQLVADHAVTVLTASPPHTPMPGVRTVAAFDLADLASLSNLVSIIQAERPDWLLMQYNPFGFERRGIAPHLPNTLQRIRRECAATRIAIMVHEVDHPAHKLKHRITNSLRNRTLMRSCRVSDAIFFPLQAWAKRFQPRFPGKPVIHLPVGSNIPFMPTNRKEIRRQLGIEEQTVVVGLFGRLKASLLMDRVRDAILSLYKVRRDIVVLYIGLYGKELSATVGADVPIIDTGPLASEEVSRHFAAIDICLVPFIEGLTTRRTTVMAGIQHGLAMVGTYGTLTDPVLLEARGKAFLLADVASSEEFTRLTLCLAEEPDLRARLGSAARELYEREFSWKSSVRRMIETLETVQR